MSYFKETAHQLYYKEELVKTVYEKIAVFCARGENNTWSICCLEKMQRLSPTWKD